MFKKIVLVVVIAAVSTSAVARDIKVYFTNGSDHTYFNAPDAVTQEQLDAKVREDYGFLQVLKVEGMPAATPEANERFCSSTACQVVVGLLAVGLIVYGVQHLAPGKTHPCVNPSDRARDGSLCGARASSVRPGGA
jgi:hypothetical protein